MNPRSAYQSGNITDEELSNLSRDERRTIERRGKRALYDLPEELIKAIALTAEKNRTTHSMIAGSLLAYGLREIQSGRLQIKDLLTPCDSPRYEYKIDLADLMDRWGVKSKRK